MTTIRCEVSDIIKGSFDNNDGPRVISPYGVEMRRVALLGFVVNRYSSEGYASITIDDGSGTIRSKGWGADANALNSVELNSFVLVIGKVREYEGEMYIVPEIIRSVSDPNLLTLHKLERLRTLLQRSGVSGIEAPDDMVDTSEQSGLVVASSPTTKSPPSTDNGPSASAPLQKQILQFIQSHDGPVSNDEILAFFGERGYPKSEVTHKILDLLDDGLITEDPIGVFKC